jgi:hypothetical protein
MSERSKHLGHTFDEHSEVFSCKHREQTPCPQILVVRKGESTVGKREFASLELGNTLLGVLALVLTLTLVPAMKR